MSEIEVIVKVIIGAALVIIGMLIGGRL